MGSIYNKQELNSLRFFCNLYFHGHSVGGTNPSLLEAMASNCLIVANNNIFNKSILGEDALYFNSFKEISNYLDTISKSDYAQSLENNIIFIWKLKILSSKHIDSKFKYNSKYLGTLLSLSSIKIVNSHYFLCFFVKKLVCYEKIWE